MLDATAAAYEELQVDYQAVREELKRYLRWVFGRRRERLRDAPGQLHLFEIPEHVLPPPEPLETQESETSAAEPPQLTTSRQPLREREANPVLDRIECKLNELQSSVLPKSSLGKAVTYARNQWQALRRYTTDGRLTIDNNMSERTLRHQAIGRKNWLFLGNDAAGERAATLYTVMATAKRHRIEPWAYVTDLLLKLTDDTPELESLLPERWIDTHPDARLIHRVEESHTKQARQKSRRSNHCNSR